MEPRRARGLPFWFSLATHGTKAYTEAIERTLAVARAATENHWPRVDVKTGRFVAPGVNGGLQGSRARFMIKLGTPEERETGASGRYDYLREIALDYAFFLTHLGIGE